ncbi:MAG TPA: S53 family peptidase [Candidatus Dormibacteraeota bacterium]|nr:S53 family peptidase [Candidatus Dormibacteraeota bacterium]
MRSGLGALLCLCATLALSLVAPTVRAAAPPAPPAIPGLQQLHVSGAVDRGPIAPRTVDLTVVLPLRDRLGAEALAAALHRPGDPAFRRYLRPGEFATLHGADPGSVAAVAAWARAAGLEVTSVSSSRTLVRLRGPSDRVERAVGVRLHALHAPGLDYTAPDRDGHLPPALAGRVSAVLGLGDLGRLGLPTHPQPQPEPPLPHLPLPSLHLSHWGPAGLWTFYNAPPQVRGAGQTIAVFAAGDVSHAQSDLALFEARQGLPPVRWTTIPVGPPSTETAGSPEWDLDTQWSTGMAPDVSDLLVYVTTSLSGGDIASEFERWVRDGRAPQASASFGACESIAYLTGIVDALDPLLLQAVTQGQSLFAASGDSGSFCPAVIGVNGVPAGLPGPLYPASSTNAISVGGTTITGQTGMLREVAWKAGGGGISHIERPGGYQSGAGGSYLGLGRGTPDVSLDADPLSGYTVVVDGKDLIIGGTSASAPAWLGIWARAQQAHGGHLGFADEAIYRVPATAFHDVVAGSQVLHDATPGWDYCTGRGTPDISALVTAA